METREIQLFDAKARFSEVIKLVEKGVVFQVTKRGKTVAEIRPAGESTLPLTKGCAANPGFRMGEDFDDTPEDFADYLG